MLDIGTRIHQHDGKLTFERFQDCNAIAERAKAMHNEGIHGSSEMRLAASLPFVIVEKYCNDNGITFQEFCNNPAHTKRIVEAPENAAFRIWKGKL